MKTGRRFATLLCAITAIGVYFAWTPAVTATPASTIWPLGDSITYGYAGTYSEDGHTEYTDTPGGYRTTLNEELDQDKVAHEFIGTTNANNSPALEEQSQGFHDGHMGYRIDQITADLDGVAGGQTDDGGYWMTRASDPIQPDVVILLIGTNDIYQDYDPSRTFPTANGEADFSAPSQVAEFVADMTSRLQSLIQKIESLDPGAKIVLCDTTPMNLSGTGQVDSVTGEYASAVASLANQEAGGGVPISYVDIWSNFVESSPNGEMVVPGLLGSDGIHPTAAGYQLIAEVLKGPVESILAG